MAKLSQNRTQKFPLKAGGISTLKTCSVFPVTQPMSMSGLHLRLSGKCYQDLLYLSNPLTSDHSFLTSEQLNHTPGSCFSTVSLGHNFPSSNMGNWRTTEAMNFLWHTPLFTAFFCFFTTYSSAGVCCVNRKLIQWLPPCAAHVE